MSWQKQHANDSKIMYIKKKRANVVVGFDGAVHMSEEVRKARHAVPRAMFWTIVLNGILAYAIVLVFLFCLGDLDAAINDNFQILDICTQEK